MVDGDESEMGVPAEVQEFIAKVQPERRRRDAETLLELFTRVTGAEPTLWGTIIGFGWYHYKYESGREGETAAVGFAPRPVSTSARPIPLLSSWHIPITVLGRSARG